MNYGSGCAKLKYCILIDLKFQNQCITNINIKVELFFNKYWLKLMNGGLSCAAEMDHATQTPKQAVNATVPKTNCS